MGMPSLFIGVSATKAGWRRMGLRYVSSWVDTGFRRCFQVMECQDRALLDQWMAQWNDLIDFEVVTVISSPDAAAAIAPRL